MKNIPQLFFLTLSIFSSACSVTTPELNHQLSQDKEKKPLANPPATNKRSKEFTLMMTFSGGGTRSAALSYGVLEQLRDTPIIIEGKETRLLDEIDLISSVSGGSFTSAYFGLFGDKIFEDFEEKFLKRKVQTELLRTSLLSPKAWVRLAPTNLFERSDLAAEYFNNTIFDKKTFADIRPDAPTVVINATDLSLGQGFSFTKYHFDWICSDLNSYPISRAVAASAAVPVLFSPITLKNHATHCEKPPSVWQVPDNNPSSLVETKQETEKRHIDALRVKNYRDDENLKYLHLVDGGVADNLGIRSIIDIVSFHNNNIWDAMKIYGMKESKKMVFITVNAASYINPSIGKLRHGPSSISVIDTTTTIQANKYSTETIDLLRQQFPKWREQVEQGRCKELNTADCAEIDFQLIEINLEDLKQSEIAKLGIIPTSLELPNETVDQLKSAGKRLLQRSEKFRSLIESFNN